MSLCVDGKYEESDFCLKFPFAHLGIQLDRKDFTPSQHHTTGGPWSVTADNIDGVCDKLCFPSGYHVSVRYHQSEVV